MKKYLYQIELDETSCQDMILLKYGKEAKNNPNRPIFLRSKKGNLYCIAHGSKDGYYVVMKFAYRPEDFYDLYKTYALLNREIVLNTITCYGKYIPNLKKELMRIKPAIRSKHVVYTCFQLQDHMLQIFTKEKVKIPKRLRDDIIFVKKTKFEKPKKHKKKKS